MILQSLILLYIAITIIIISVDLLPQIKDWTSRIGIGKYQDLSTWNKRIIKRGVRWLLNTPKIKVTDNNRLVIVDILQGNYSSSAIQHWQEASLLLGLSEYLKDNDDREVKETIIKYLDSKFDGNGKWIERPEYVDCTILSYAVMKLEFIDADKYKKAFDFTWELIKEHIGDDGTVMYRKTMKDYRYVDTIGFICPFLVKYGLKYGVKESIDLAVKQIKEYEKYGLHHEIYIPSHAYKIENHIPLGLCGWGRGLGWFAIGLIDSWNELPFNHHSKSELTLIVKRFVQSVISFQNNNGSWSWTVTRSECRPDSSTTATLSWFLLIAAELEELSQQCLSSAEKALNYLSTVTRKSGAVDLSQGDTKDIGVYSTVFNVLPFTQGFSIRCVNFKVKVEKLKVVS